MKQEYIIYVSKRKYFIVYAFQWNKILDIYYSL